MKKNSNTSVKTAIVPVGGYGTRFLPASKSIPKEMFPLLDKPVVYFVVEELVKSGIENIIFVVGHRKQSVEDFFSLDDTFEEFLLDHGKEEKVRELRRIATMANFSFVYTAPPYGNGAALRAAKHALQIGEPFVVTWGDEFIYTQKTPRIQQCIETFEKYGRPVISGIEIPNPADRCRYGMGELEAIEGEDDVFTLKGIIEKPAAGSEPSPYATHGAYVLPYEVYDVLDDVHLGKNGEFWLTDVLNVFSKRSPLMTRIIRDGIYLDCGTPEHLLHASIQLALKTPAYAENLKAFLHAQLQE